MKTTLQKSMREYLTLFPPKCPPNKSGQWDLFVDAQRRGIVPEEIYKDVKTGDPEVARILYHTVRNHMVESNKNPVVVEVAL